MDPRNRIVVILRSSRNLLAAVVLLAVPILSAAPAQALSWTNVWCAAGAECPKVGVPTGPCTCGFWKDSPASETANSETVFVFVKSTAANPATDETAMWKATFPAADYSAYDRFRVRAGVNDYGGLEVILYKNTGGAAFNNCEDNKLMFPDILAIASWASGGAFVDDSVLSRQDINPIVIASGDSLGVCIRITDNPDTAAPASQRSSAQACAAGTPGRRVPAATGSSATGQGVPVQVRNASR
ncbi:MAG TPA: hypothetical protein VFW45_11340 [Candidatus Polarisedimenticolia bacterium]|nr:hypothetical protein [Candidatus Polarisedimenticolia bacterium]